MFCFSFVMFTKCVSLLIQNNCVCKRVYNDLNEIKRFLMFNNVYRFNKNYKVTRGKSSFFIHFRQ